MVLERKHGFNTALFKLPHCLLHWNKCYWFYTEIKQNQKKESNFKTKYQSWQISNTQFKTLVWIFSNPDAQQQNEIWGLKMKRTALHKNGKTIHRDKGQFCQQMICRQLEIYICKKWIDRYLTSCVKSNANRSKTLFTTIKIGNVNLPTSIQPKKVCQYNKISFS